MLRSMFTAVSALNLHQSYLDVIADNLANANTPGFKASRMLFQDQIAQLISPESAPTDNLGGKNPTQIGMGIQIGNTLQIFTQGMLQATGRNLDVSIQGDGFLIYQGADGTRYSREGSLTLDAAGTLVNSSTGMRVQGWLVDEATGLIDTNSPVGDIRAQLDRSIARATQNATVAGNLNPNDKNTPTSATNDAKVTYTVYDSLGAPHDVQITFTYGGISTTTGLPEWSWEYAYKDASGAYVTPTTGNGGTLTFDSDGQLSNASPLGSITIPTAAMNGSTDTTFDVDFSNITSLVTGTSRSDVAMTYQDGVMSGRVTDLTVDSNTGQVILQYSNGLREPLGQLAVARFNNPTGLLRKGHTSFAESLASGTPNIGAAATGGRGTITPGYLEASNVDMANEFTNMILAQRGFQAQTRVITTSDEMLAELVNLKR